MWSRVNWRVTSASRFMQRRCTATTLSHGAEVKNLDYICENIATRNLWHAIYSLPKRRPFLSSVGLIVGCNVVSDVVVQKSVDPHAKLDTRRIGIFAAFGIFQATSAWWVYMHVFRKLCPNTFVFANLSWREKLAHRGGQIDIAKQIFLDNFVYIPIITFPGFYMVKALMESVDASVVGCSAQGLQLYSYNFWKDNMSSTAMWTPLDVIVFSVPAWARVQVSTLGNILWVGALSWFRGEAA